MRFRALVRPVAVERSRGKQVHAACDLHHEPANQHDEETEQAPVPTRELTPVLAKVGRPQRFACGERLGRLAAPDFLSTVVELADRFRLVPSDSIQCLDVSIR